MCSGLNPAAAAFAPNAASTCPTYAHGAGQSFSERIRQLIAAALNSPNSPRRPPQLFAGVPPRIGPTEWRERRKAEGMSESEAQGSLEAYNEAYRDRLIQELRSLPENVRHGRAAHIVYEEMKENGKLADLKVFPNNYRRAMPKEEGRTTARGQASAPQRLFDGISRQQPHAADTRNYPVGRSRQEGETIPRGQASERQRLANALPRQQPYATNSAVVPPSTNIEGHIRRGRPEVATSALSNTYHIFFQQQPDRASSAVIPPSTSNGEDIRRRRRESAASAPSNTYLASSQHPGCRLHPVVPSSSIQRREDSGEPRVSTSLDSLGNTTIRYSPADISDPEVVIYASPESFSSSTMVPDPSKYLVPCPDGIRDCPCCTLDNKPHSIDSKLIQNSFQGPINPTSRCPKGWLDCYKTLVDKTRPPPLEFCRLVVDEHSSAIHVTKELRTSRSKERSVNEPTTPEERPKLDVLSPRWIGFQKKDFSSRRVDFVKAKPMDEREARWELARKAWMVKRMKERQTFAVVRSKLLKGRL